MKKKTVIVTGASGNLGQAVVNKFLAEQYRVVGTVIPEDPFVIKFKNPNFEKSVVDLVDEEATDLFVMNVIKMHGQIDVAVLTVGGFALGKIEDTTSADIMKQYKLNFETAYNVTRPVFRQMMKQKKGHIFFIGSRPGLDARNAKGMVAYSLAKSLIFRLAALLNEEAKGNDVVANVIIPSTIDTPQNRVAMPDAEFESWVKPESIAEIIYLHTTGPTSILRESLIKVYGNS